MSDDHAQSDVALQNLEKLESLLRHINNVRENALIVARKLIQDGDPQLVNLALLLMKQVQSHDDTKFLGVEWEYLGAEAGKAKLDIAIHQHNTTNSHHPEFWSGISSMPRVALGELVCDWKARATEFGTSLREWVDDGAMQRFGYKKNDKTYKEIMFFVDLLCDKPFKQNK